MAQTHRKQLAHGPEHSRVQRHRRERWCVVRECPAAGPARSIPEHPAFAAPPRVKWCQRNAIENSCSARAEGGWVDTPFGFGGGGEPSASGSGARPAAASAAASMTCGEDPRDLL